MNEELLSQFESFQKLPRTALVDRPDEFVETGFHMSGVMTSTVFGRDLSVFFTRRSLKHLAEKGEEGQRLINLIPQILEMPDRVSRSKSSQRIIVSRSMSGVKKKTPHAIVLETSKQKAVIVTVFAAKRRYLENFEILWRTASL